MESAWVRVLKVLGKFGGKRLGMRAWKVRGYVGVESAWVWARKVRGYGRGKCLGMGGESLSVV